jgi:hypothetical protein
VHDALLIFALGAHRPVGEEVSPHAVAAAIDVLAGHDPAVGVRFRPHADLPALFVGFIRVQIVAGHAELDNRIGFAEWRILRSSE